MDQPLPPIAVATYTRAVEAYFREIVRIAGFSPVPAGAEAAFCLSDGAFEAKNGADAAVLTVRTPIRAEILVKNLRTMAQARGDGGIVTIGAFTLDKAEKTWRGGAGGPVRLTEKEIALLDCLARNRGSTVSRQRLHAEIWSYTTELETHTLETHIYRLRQKIEPDAAAPSIILTTPDGYRLAAGGEDGQAGGAGGAASAPRIADSSES